jgi:catechol 2,3-dioxygenase-like lactoylglutathione lyase family enzyme
MIDHTGLNVSDYAKSKAFYERALAPLGYAVIMELPRQYAPEGAMGLGVPPKPDFWVAGGVPQSPRLHVAFRAANRAGTTSKRSVTTLEELTPSSPVER